MPVFVTNIHDPNALDATCRRFGLPPPRYATSDHEHQRPAGWLVHVPGTLSPIVCNTLTGFVAYHIEDNVFSRYARIMRFIHLYYAVRHQRRNRRRLASSAA
jgi:hypothetical protein